MANDDNKIPADPDASTADLGKPSSAALPEKIGPYRILEQIGEGGMGIVYLAEQTEPVRRRVALKVIKLGMDTKQVIARFEAERQALAMMDHPCVARVFDAGVSDDGRSYFVMEHVPGVPITEHCDRQRLSIDQRLNLFIEVCNAVQHAHQKGIIHRDLKPGNILVTAREGSAVPKVIDFGVAKALHHKLTEKTLFTEQGQLIGTPEYMSPEQAEMTAQDIDTRSDIYSLGVLLYELLTGALPFDPKSLREAAFGEIQRIIREVEPAKPSTKFSSLGDESTTSAQKRRLDTRSLTRELRGDLDWIVMKALEKDRERRYETANGLAADIGRHLNNEPVIASPPSAAYRMHKFIRRNRVPVAAAVIVAVVLIGGVIGTTWQAIRATRAERMSLAAASAERVARKDAEEQKREAQAERAEAQAINDFLNNDLLAAADPERLGRDVTVREVLDKASQKISTAFPHQPEVEAALRRTIGKTYTGLGLYDQAEKHIRRALVLWRDQPGEHGKEIVMSLHSLWAVLWREHRYVEAEVVALEAYEIRSSLLGEYHLDTVDSLSMLSSTRRAIGRTAEADEMLLNVLIGLFPDVTTRDEAQSFVESETAEIHKLWSAGDRVGAQARIRKHLEPFLAVPFMREFVPQQICHGAEILAERGDRVMAESGWRVGLEISREVLGEYHPDMLHMKGHFASSLHDWGELEEAELLQRQAFEGKTHVLGPEHPDTIISKANLARLLHDLGELEEAEKLMQEAVVSSRPAFGEYHPNTIAVRNSMAKLLIDLERYGEAETMLLQAYYAAAESPERDQQTIDKEIKELSSLYEQWGKPDQAAEWRAKLPQPDEKEETSPKTERESDADKDN